MFVKHPNGRSDLEVEPLVFPQDILGGKAVLYIHLH